MPTAGEVEGEREKLKFNLAIYYVGNPNSNTELGVILIDHVS
jgi:hypothetical protein